MAEEQLPPLGPSAEEVEWVVDQLVEMKTFLEIARKYGFALTATPKGRMLLDASRHPEIPLIRFSVCPVESDPWTRVRK